MIIREMQGVSKKQNTKKIQPVERMSGDPDLRWKSGETTFSVYVLDVHEFFDPCTSTKGRHMMHGPAVIAVEDSVGMRTCEYHVNNPFVWNWVGRCIREGYLSPETIQSPSDERKLAK